MKRQKNVKSFKVFNENLNIFDVRNSKINESDEIENIDIEDFDNEYINIRVKDIISFLQKFDPETPVYLDKDGWPNELWGERYRNMDVEDKIRYLIDDSAILYRGENYLMINN